MGKLISVYFVSGHSFNSSSDHSRDSTLKRLSQFSVVGRLASEEVVIGLSLLHAKCLPVHLYGVVACPVLVRDKQSLEFIITRSLIKLFRFVSANVVTDYHK